ncbi:hypothetical protein BZG36_00489 [Bifiguratus adelaidae]|uniref:Utp8 beta-propeller domain-containing protein n=1 Tax=Bifiguratus adelaidae TaxID=1938954 RepID=A0A261Y7X1_9FUNG|nr:hypothetical protein BZG36_00489 [Bifiguratus adelaidae]
MPGANLDEPYLLTRYTSTALRRSKQYAPIYHSVPLSSADAEAKVDDLVLLTTQGEGIELYNTNDQKLLKSWTCSPDVSFACSAVYIKTDAAERVFAVVQGGNEISEEDSARVLWQWNEATTAKTVSTSLVNGNVSTKTEHKFSEPIYALECDPRYPSKLIMVSKAGNITMFDTHTMHQITSASATQKYNVAWACLLPSHEHRTYLPYSSISSASALLLTAGESTNAKDCWALHAFLLDFTASQVRHITSIDIKHKFNNPPAAYTFDASSGCLTTLSRIGHLTVHRLHFGTSPREILSLEIRQCLSMTMDPSSSATKTRAKKSEMRTSVAVAAVGDRYVAVLRGRDVGNDVFEHLLTLWDTKYGTLQAEQSVKVSSTGSQLSTRSIYKLCSLPNQALACSISTPSSATNTKSSRPDQQYRTSVLVSSYHCPPLSLLSSMRRLQPSQQKTSAEFDAVGVIPAAQDLVSEGVLQKWQLVLQSQQDREQDVLKKLMAQESAEDFSNLFFHVVERRTNQAIASEGLPSIEELEALNQKNDNAPIFSVATLHNLASLQQEDKLTVEDSESESDSDDDKPRKEKLQDYRQELNAWKKAVNKAEKEQLKALRQQAREQFARPSFSPAFVTAIAHRCFATDSKGGPDLGFWPQQVVVYLITHHFLHSSMVSGGIIKALVDRQSWNMVLSALAHLNDIAESELMWLLSFRFSLSSKFHGTAATDIPTLDHVLAAVISAPRNDIFFQHALRKLDSEQLKYIFTTLNNWMALWNDQEQFEYHMAPLLPNSDVPLPPYTAIVEVLTLLMDAHFATVILTDALHGPLSQLATQMQSDVEDARVLADLKGCLGLFHRKQANVKPRAKKKWEQGIPQYGVEVIHL